MKKFSGIGVSFGISKAKIYVIDHKELKVTKKSLKTDNDVVVELKNFDNALKKANQQIERLKKVAITKLGKEKAEIFDAHLSILNDPSLIDESKIRIKSEKVNASFAFWEVAQGFIDMFKNMDDPYMKERAADVKDVSSRVVKILEGLEVSDLSLINEDVIIVAHDLTPSETSQLNPKYVKGFLTEIGGKTSHSAIMARSLEIPAIVGIGKDVWKLSESSNVIMDATTGEIFLDPTTEKVNELKKRKDLLLKEKEERQKFVHKPSLSKDGWKTEIAANIGSLQDVDGVLNNGGEGVGLFRTEFLYMEAQNWPDEETQFNAYKDVLAKLKPRRVVIRTLDIGGDKTLSYYKFPEEMNPFLGYRAIRLCLDQKKIFITQIRALLRASAYGKLAIDIPMIATIDEFLEAKKMFAKVEADLKKEGIKVGKYELGIMVEVPSTVELVDKFAKHVDFFSIGTNDLIQYTFAVDRMSQKISYLYQPFNPALLRKIKKVIDASHKEGKWTAICGETASEPLLLPLFVGMGLDEFSMSASEILKIRKLLFQINKAQAERLVTKGLDCETSKEVEKLLLGFYKAEKITLL